MRVAAAVASENAVPVQKGWHYNRSLSGQSTINRHRRDSIEVHGFAAVHFVIECEAPGSWSSLPRDYYRELHTRPLFALAYLTRRPPPLSSCGSFPWGENTRRLRNFHGLDRIPSATRYTGCEGIMMPLAATLSAVNQRCIVSQRPRSQFTAAIHGDLSDVVTSAPLFDASYRGGECRCAEIERGFLFFSATHRLYPHVKSRLAAHSRMHTALPIC